MARTGLFAKLFQDACSKDVGPAIPHYANLFATMALSDSKLFLQLLALSHVPTGAFLDLWWNSVSPHSLCLTCRPS